MTGPYLYDEGPERLHTSTPRRRNGLVLGIFGATVAVGVGMVVALPLVKGTAEEQAREVVGVFTAALAAGDLETAGGLLCQAEHDRADTEGVDVGEVAAGYARPGTAEILAVEPGEQGDRDSQEVRVRWDDGGTGTETTLVVVLEEGPRVCGTSG
ncbi:MULTISPECIES: Rv0361 family membrane protein [unclassified Geodermatophilus]